MTTWIPPGLSGRRALGNLMRVWRGSAPYGTERSQEPALWGSGVQATGSLDALEGWLTHHHEHINQSDIPLTPIVAGRCRGSEGRHCGVAVTAPRPLQQRTWAVGSRRWLSWSGLLTQIATVVRVRSQMRPSI